MRFRVGGFLLLLLTAPLGPDTNSPAAQQTALPRTGVITGTVIDQSGIPLVGARVEAVGRRKKWLGPFYELSTASSDESDDRGQFRLHSLPPGRYVVAVSVQTQAPAPQQGVGYVRTYNPGTTSLAEAESIDVRAGEERSVSVRVMPTRFMTVTGIAVTSEGQPAASFDVWLRGSPATIGYTGVQGGFMTAVIATARTGADGSFALGRIPAGGYTLTVTNGYTRRGRPLEITDVPLKVTDTSLAGIKVSTARGATVSGRLEWAGAGPVPWPRNSKTLGRIRAAGVGLEFDFASLDTEVQPDGTFKFTDLYGLRRIQTMGLVFDWTVQSVDAPKDATAGPNLDIKPGHDINDVKVVVTDRTGTLAATVVDEAGAPFLDGSVLLMPRNPNDLDPLGWGFRATQKNYATAGVWTYRMASVLPGSYLAVAIDVEPYRVSGDTDLMARARAAAVPVEIREGETRLRLRVLRLRSFVQALDVHLAAQGSSSSERAAASGAKCRRSVVATRDRPRISASVAIAASTKPRPRSSNWRSRSATRA